ncbi:hypothetical protein TraAM80_07788 [Trypanosoma rangeli]|uniref:Trypanosoma Tc-38 (p38) protein domain-containing protein n=1 Tax=Trypanosoma rangeli TaxID=5698 RepID=A0A3R7M665_TRYRA|nr:uncharacterized protein TraAM80_07788 [Trypanosoma rangeli]RNF00147.1 hypothetical protein TraAM80_07788 [Trypanosoma rangeli]|eukprot:RNF00147.1 hypothetical protein TraAM80_07788 [Trypanosoma rangeli]
MWFVRCVATLSLLLQSLLHCVVVRLIRVFCLGMLPVQRAIKEGAAGLCVSAQQRGAMATIRRRVPRFFTSAAFTEEVGRGLLTFAHLHGLMSNVWVPKRLVGNFKADVTLLPNAIIWDVSLTPGCGATDMKAIEL